MYNLDNVIAKLNKCETAEEYLDILYEVAKRIDRYLRNRRVTIYDLENKLSFIIKQNVKYNFNKNNKGRYNYCLTEIKKGIINFYGIDINESKVKDFNSYIKSLKIYKLKESGLSLKKYDNSNDLGKDLKELVSNDDTNSMKKVYIKMVINSFDDKKISFIKQDGKFYELLESIKINPIYSSKNTTLENKADKRLQSDIEVNDIKSLFEEAKRQK